MKKVLVFFIALMITLLVLTGCTIPFFGGSSDESANLTKDGDLARLDDDTESTGAGVSGADSQVGNVSTSDAGAGGAGAGNAAEGDATAGNAGASDATAAVVDIIGADRSGESSVESSGSTSADGSKSAAAAGMDNGKNEPANSLYSENNGTDAVGAINPAGGVLDNDQSSAVCGSEYASAGTEGYQPENNSSSSTIPAAGVMAAQSTAQSNPAGSWFAEPRRPVTVYYQDKDGYVIPMTRWIQSQLGIAKAAVSLAIDCPLTREETVYYGVYPVLPENTEILGIDIKDGVAVIDFNRCLLNYGTAYSERNIIASIVYTLTEFEPIQKVSILINGYPQGVLKYGTDLTEPLGRENVMINTEPDLLSTEKKKMDVYFLKQANIGFTYPVPVSLTDSSGGADVIAEALVKKLLSADPEGGIYSEMPEGAFLISSSINNGVITLNFSEEFLNYGGTKREEGILKQLAYTLRQCDSLRKIEILVEGRKIELPEGTNISAGLAIPVTINDIMDR